MTKLITTIIGAALLCGCVTQKRVGNSTYKMISLENAMQGGAGAQFIVRWEGTNVNDHTIISQPVFHGGLKDVVASGVNGAVGMWTLGHELKKGDYSDNTTVSGVSSAEAAASAAAEQSQHQGQKQRQSQAQGQRQSIKPKSVKRPPPMRRGRGD